VVLPGIPVLGASRFARMFIDADEVEVVTRGLLGGIDVESGPTEEQLLVLGAVVASLFGRDDLDLTALKPVGPAELAAAIEDPRTRRRFHELLVALEACRHPLSAAQVARVENYATALGITGPDLGLFRTMVSEGGTRAAADFARFLDDNLAHRLEPQLAALPVVADRPEPELAARLEALHDCPEGSLGQRLLAFYERWNLPIPGTEASAMNHFYVSHDMTHVIAGLEATGPGEVALSAFQMAMNDNRTNMSALLASLIVHEVGIGNAGKLTAEAYTLADPAAARLLAEELARGSACTGDFSLIDHLAIADRSLVEIRAEFGVRPPGDPADGHHCW
jgi:hypothetical protein